MRKKLDLQQKTDTELVDLLHQQQKKLRELGFDLQLRKLKQVRKVREVKKNIARVLTLINQNKIK